MTARPITLRRTTVALWAGVLAALIPIVLVIQYVATQANAAPVGDQWWDVSYVAVKTRAGILMPEDLFIYYLGHRPFVIRLLTVIFTLLTDYNVQIMRFTAVVIALLNLIMASLLVAHKHKQVLPLAIPLFALVLFTLYHEDSWLDYYFSVWQHTLFFLLLGLLVLQRMKPGWLAFVLMLGCAIGATFSLGLGIAAWVSLPIAFLAKRTYRRWTYILVWGVALASCMLFYTSDYAVSPYETEGGAFSSQGLLHDGLPLTGLYLVQFQSTRFDTVRINLFGTTLAVISIVVLGVNSFVLVLQGERQENIAPWASLALFSVGGAGLTVLGRGVAFPIAARYSPGADGFWLALVVLGLLVIAQRPRPFLAAANVVVLVLTVLLTVQKDVWLRQRNADPYPEACDQCVLDTPLKRDGCFRACFYWGDEQSVYHFAALRLSVFRNVSPRLILPERGAPVVSDMPNRWLSVYVRDYLLAEIPAENLIHIAPESGTWALPNTPYSPFYRGEWSTDILPHPLENIRESAEAFAADLPMHFDGQPRVWYINTPETQGNFEIINAAFTDAGYVGERWTVNDPLYATARFGVWCFVASTGVVSTGVTSDDGAKGVDAACAVGEQD